MNLRTYYKNTLILNGKYNIEYDDSGKTLDFAISELIPDKYGCDMIKFVFKPNIKEWNYKKDIMRKIVEKYEE